MNDQPTPQRPARQLSIREFRSLTAALDIATEQIEALTNAYNAQVAMTEAAKAEAARLQGELDEAKRIMANATLPQAA